MKLEQSFEVTAPPDTVWKLLIDVEQIAPCLPGAAITEVDEEGTYHGTFQVKLGPTTAAYRGTLRIDSADEANKIATLKAKGTDKRGQGGAQATIINKLVEIPGGTRVETDTDFTITGKLARFGRGGMIQDISNRMLKEFAGCLQDKLASGEVAAPEPAAAAPAAAEPESAPPAKPLEPAPIEADPPKRSKPEPERELEPVADAADPADEAAAQAPDAGPSPIEAAASTPTAEAPAPVDAPAAADAPADPANQASDAAPDGPTPIEAAADTPTADAPAPDGAPAPTDAPTDDGIPAEADQVSVTAAATPEAPKRRQLAQPAAPVEPLDAGNLAAGMALDKLRSNPAALAGTFAALGALIVFILRRLRS